MEKIAFSCDLLSLVQTALQIYIDKNKQTLDAAYYHSSIELIYEIYDKSDILNLLDLWSKNNNGEIELFKYNLNDDSEKLWQIVWDSAAFKKILKKKYCMGTNGPGVFDNTVGIFYPCKTGDHYMTIIHALKKHLDMYMLYKEFIRNLKPIKKLDDFILDNFILINNKNCKNWYTPTQRQY